LGLIPDKAYTSLKAIAKTLYRMYRSKKHLLEWTTAEEAEKNSKTDLISYNKSMWFNLVCGIGLIVFTIIKLFFKNGSILLLGLGILWVITPSVMKIISKKQTEEMAIDYLTKEEKEYLLDVGRKTWSYFKE